MTSLEEVSRWGWVNEFARLREELRDSQPASATARAANRCYQLVQTALIFGAVELAARLGVPDEALPF